jgi:hypothetical protein
MKVEIKKALLPWIYVALIAVFSCDTSDNDSKMDPSQEEEGYATGLVTDSNGKPMKGATVVIDNTMFYNSNIIVTTKEDGKYKAKLPTVGTYNVTATVVKELNGATFTVDLHPENTEILSNEGGVRNFQLKLTGKKADGLGYYGGTVSINSAILSNISDPENIEFTLEPVGKLIDGSTGKTLVVKSGAPYTQDYGYLVDIPLGRYNMKAMYPKDNTKVPLKIRKKFDNNSVYSTTFQLDFEPETSFGNNLAIIEYSE